MVVAHLILASNSGQDGLLARGLHILWVPLLKVGENHDYFPIVLVAWQWVFEDVCSTSITSQTRLLSWVFEVTSGVGALTKTRK